MEPEHSEEQSCDIDSGRKGVMTHDSLVTVRLSEPQLTIDTEAGERILDEDDGAQVSAAGLELNEANESPAIIMRDSTSNEAESARSQDADSRRGSNSSEASDRVNWEELAKTEEQEPRDQGSDDVRACLSSMESY
jgi:hypothetical protein